MRTGALALLLVGASAAGAAPGRLDAAPTNETRAMVRSESGGPRETFSVSYVVEVRASDPTMARVRWELAGIDEVRRVRLKFDPERFTGFEGSGAIERRRGEIRWSPSGPYAHLQYVARLNHRHSAGKGFDSYAGDGWVLTRTSGLFPRSAVLFRPEVEPSPEGRTRLVFRLPAGWEAVSTMPPLGPRTFAVESAGRFDHPRGWIVLGHFRSTDAVVGGTAVTIAVVPHAVRPPEQILGFLEEALPPVTGLFGRTPPRLLIVVGADPMWRGGLSGEESFYMHADRPLQTPDRTSPYLHELFHVLAPFRPAPDAHWVTEGLAEFYSIEIQRRTGRLDLEGYHKALGLFARYGRWGRDFTRDQDRDIHNNSAPLLMYALDRRLQGATAGARGLDAVVGALAADGGVVTTARFLGTVQRVAGKSFSAFFREHVYRGERPRLPEIEPLTEGGPGRGGVEPDP